MKLLRNSAVALSLGKRFIEARNYIVNREPVGLKVADRPRGVEPPLVGRMLAPLVEIRPAGTQDLIFLGKTVEKFPLLTDKEIKLQP